MSRSPWIVLLLGLARWVCAAPPPDAASAVHDGLFSGVSLEWEVLVPSPSPGAPPETKQRVLTCAGEYLRLETFRNGVAEPYRVYRRGEPRAWEISPEGTEAREVVPPKPVSRAEAARARLAGMEAFLGAGSRKPGESPRARQRRLQASLLRGIASELLIREAQGTSDAELAQELTPLTTAAPGDPEPWPCKRFLRDTRRGPEEECLASLEDLGLRTGDLSALASYRQDILTSGFDLRRWVGPGLVEEEAGFAGLPVRRSFGAGGEERLLDVSRGTYPAGLFRVPAGAARKLASPAGRGNPSSLLRNLMSESRTTPATGGTR